MCSSTCACLGSLFWHSRTVQAFLLVRASVCCKIHAVCCFRHGHKSHEGNKEWRRVGRDCQEFQPPLHYVHCWSHFLCHHHPPGPSKAVSCHAPHRRLRLPLRPLASRLPLPSHAGVRHQPKACPVHRHRRRACSCSIRLPCHTLNHNVPC